MVTVSPRPANAATDLRLARLHLRMGQLGLARAELEALAGSGDLDDGGLLALAEARWRTGDLAGAGEAAQAYLSMPGAGAIAGLVIAAEAIAVAGRPTEARRIAGVALEQPAATLERIFAGMPRTSIWPAESVDIGQHTSTLFGADAPGRGRSRTAAAPAGSLGPEQNGNDGPGFWDGEHGEPELPEPAEVLDAARVELTGGHLGAAAVRLALVLRTAPELAPAVLEATDPRSRRSAEIELVRGDAFRLVGHELDARRAWAAAAATMPPPGDRSGGASGPAEES